MTKLPDNLVSYVEVVAAEIWPDCGSCIYHETDGGDCIRHAPHPVSLRFKGSPRDDSFASVFRPFVFVEDRSHACGEWVGFRDLVDFEGKRFIDPNEMNSQSSEVAA